MYPKSMKVWQRPLDRQVKTDIRNHEDFWESQRGVIKKAFGRWNDIFLKANMQSDGRLSYGRFVDLLIAARRKDIK